MEMIWLKFIDWPLRVTILVVNIWLFTSIFKSGEVHKIYIFLMIYFLIINDCLAFVINIFHDIPSYFQNSSVLEKQPIFYNASIFILCCQWFFHLFFLPVFSLLHFTALFFPFLFRKFNIRSIVVLVIILYALTTAVTIPLYTSCCGYMYHTDYKYWFFDYTKPYTMLYQTGNNYLQVFCVTIMILANIAIVTRLYRLRRNTNFFSQTSIVIPSGGQRIDVEPSGVSGRTTERSLQPKRKRTLGPEVRLAISFVMLSGCFFASTLSFNFLMGSKNPFLATIDLLSGYVNQSKWIVYCLGNRHIRRIFFSPRRVFCFK